MNSPFALTKLVGELMDFHKDDFFSSRYPLTLSERLSIAFSANGKREFVPRDQVFHVLVVYCSKKKKSVDSREFYS